MELHQLRYFCGVADTGSFSRAAEQAHVARERQALMTSRKIFEKEGRGHEGFDALIEARANVLTLR